MLPAAYRRSGSNPSPRGAMMRRVAPQKESVTTKIDRRLKQVDHRLSFGRLGVVVVVLMVVLFSFTYTSERVTEKTPPPPQLSGTKEKDLFQQFRAFAEDVAHIDVDAVERASKEDAESLRAGDANVRFVDKLQTFLFEVIQHLRIRRLWMVKSEFEYSTIFSAVKRYVNGEGLEPILWT